MCISIFQSRMLPSLSYNLLYNENTINCNIQCNINAAQSNCVHFFYKFYIFTYEDGIYSARIIYYGKLNVQITEQCLA